MTSSKNLPNILFICTDQQRGDSLNCTGAPWAVTPNLDKLAGEGALFHNCYVQNPVCSPSRASLFTGKYVANHGLHANGVPLPARHTLFTRLLADAGYDCGMIGKQHLSPCDSWQTEPRRDDGYRVFKWAHGPNHRALENDYHAWLRKTHPEIYSDIFPDKGGNESTAYSNKASTGTPIDHVKKEAHYSHWVTECAREFIAHPRAQSEPFCLVANFFDPHHSFGAPQEFRDLIDSDAIPEPWMREDELSNKPSEQTFYSKTSYAGVAPGFQDYTKEQIREIRAQYWAMIALVDYEVGRMLQTLEESGLAENTLVVFTSDHGEMLGNHQQLLKGPQLYDDLTHVPLIVRWPGWVEPAQSIDQLVQWIDLPATFLDAAGCAKAKGVQGESLIPLMRGENIQWRNWALSEYRDSGFTTDPQIMTTMLRHEQWKLIVWHGAPATGGQRNGELYDLSADPHELYNLFHDSNYAAVRQQLKLKLLDVMAETEDRAQPRVRQW
ncbi:MAG: sulfatase-like hydrolase/transferase [Granulosicoccus sp.]|nr:sulfatase-like hydrolase/transferase [Granulosicoccus sp.]